MQNEFLFSKINCAKGSTESQILVFAEFYQHDIQQKADFPFASLTILIPQCLQSTPIYQSKN